jgi:ABC-2 type transport system permease protein
MNKIFVIIKREFVTRVRKKSFIVMTILGPILFAALMVVPVWLATSDLSEQRVIQVVDQSGLFQGKFAESSSFKFQYIEEALDSAKENVSREDIYGLLYIPDLNIYEPSGITFFSRKSPSLDIVHSIQSTLSRELEDIKIGRSGIEKDLLERLKTNVNIETINLTNEGEKKGSAEINTVVGFITSFILYFFIFIYGAQVMRGVIEEKTNRIVEVIISSVKPFQLLLGKIIGVASVGLAQFLLWVILTTAIYTGIGGFFNLSSRFQGMNQAVVSENGMAQNPMPENMADIMQSIASLDIPLILFSFLFYFLGGYFLYGALFAAVGSAADNDTDTQQFMLPITIPLIFSIMSLNVVLKDPDGSFAIWLSMIPFTSPVIMMMRIPFGVPFYQLLLSMLLLVGGFLFTTWVAGKIYRIGILVHGSKVNYKILGKWIMMKN